MDDYRATAFYVAIWYAFLAALGAVLLIVLNDVQLAAGLLIAANLALVFAFVLMALAGRLNDRRITRGLFWRALPPQTRPSGEGGRRLARRALEETWLRFAKGAAMIAIVLCCLAYASNGVNAATWTRVLGKPIVAQLEPGKAPWAGYRSTR
jgi:hypothetical protein